MRELRLVPAAVVVWAVSIAVSLGWDLAAVLFIAAVAFGCMAAHHKGQALLVLGMGAAALVATAARRAQAKSFEFGHDVMGRAIAEPIATASGGYLVRLDVEGYPAQLPVFVQQLPDGTDGTDGIVAGTVVHARATVSPADSPGLAAYVANGDIVSTAAPDGLAGWAASVAANFREVVETSVGPASRGLMPGMVLGDTSMQSEAEKQLYIDTGLSHLSAVSGSNVAIVTTAAVLACTTAALSPRWQFVGALAALGVFVVLVGPEPSVLRASVTGVVALLAVVNSTRMEPAHALSLSVVVLLLISGELATSFGFALSVAATAGIVALQPVFYRWLAPIGWPDILVRGLAVAIAADVTTMPIIALMAGEVSVVSVLANVLVAPATAPITIVGLVAAAAAQLPVDWPAVFLLKAVEPFTWWIHTVAAGCQGLPVSTVSASPLVVLLAYGWIVAGLLLGHPIKTLGIVVGILTAASCAGAQHRAPVVPLDSIAVHVVETEEEVGSAPPGTQAIIVRSGEGRPRDRPSRTKEGIPVLYPARDGPVSLHADGTQHAADGRF